MNTIGGEPAGGDFVAFLDQLQKRQLQALGAPHRPLAPAHVKQHTSGADGHKPPTPAAADALRHRPAAEDRSKRTLPEAGTLLTGLAGLGALFLGLVDGFNLIAIVVGAWFLLRAFRALRNAAKGG